MTEREDGRRVAWEKPESWRLVVETVRRPDGALVERGYVEHPGSVVLVPLQEDRVIMLAQYRPALGTTILECPAGTRGWDEAWNVCAQRELREETGYRAGRFQELGLIWPVPGVSDERMWLALAQDLTPDPLPGDFDEQIELRPMVLSDLVAMARDGRLEDAKSVVAILRAAAFLEAAGVELAGAPGDRIPPAD